MTTEEALIIEEALTKQGISEEARDGAFNFNLPDKTRAEMRVVRTSKIKVRKFGSAYRLEPHNKYEERWQELRMDRDLSNLWKPSALAERHIGLRLFLFIGFAKEPEPFGKELAQLSEQLRWSESGSSYETRTWADREDRHFFVRLSAWSRPNP